MAPLLAALLCGAVLHSCAAALASDAGAVVSTAATPTPAPLGVRLPDRWPRAEAWWDHGGRYRFFKEPKLTFEDQLPHLELDETSLIDGRLGFRLHVDAAGFVERGDVEPISDRVDVRRAFLTTGGTIRLGRPIRYNLEFGFLDRQFYLDSAWLMARDVPWVGSIKLGALDVPAGFDNLVSSRDRTFMEVAAPIQAFVPSTSPGIQAQRSFRGGRGSWTLGWFTIGQRRDVGDSSRALARLAGRVTWLVRDEEKRRPLPVLHLGLSGNYTFAGENHIRYQARPESFLAPIAVDAAPSAARQAFVLGLEVAGRRGPLSVQGEYLHVFVDGGADNFDGLYVAAAYLLTGEQRPYDREGAVFGQVVPRRPLSVRARDFGALECAARWSYINLDDEFVSGGRMHVLTAGLNWYWNRWVRWQFNHELALIDGGPLDGRLHVFQARFQLVF